MFKRWLNPGKEFKNKLLKNMSLFQETASSVPANQPGSPTINIMSDSEIESSVALSVDMDTRTLVTTQDNDRNGIYGHDHNVDKVGSPKKKRKHKKRRNDDDSSSSSTPPASSSSAALPQQALAFTLPPQRPLAFDLPPQRSRVHHPSPSRNSSAKSKSSREMLNKVVKLNTTKRKLEADLRKVECSLAAYADNVPFEGVPTPAGDMAAADVNIDTIAARIEKLQRDDETIQLQMGLLNREWRALMGSL